MSDFVRNIESLQEDLLRVAEGLDEHCKNVRIALWPSQDQRALHIHPSGVVTALFVVALIAAPFTMGASLAPIIVAGVFGGIGTVGGLTSSGALITGTIIEKVKIRELQSKWEKFQEEYRHIAAIQGCSAGDIVQIARTLGASGRLVKDQVDAIVGTIGMANCATAKAATTATAEASTVAAAKATTTATAATGKAAATTSARLATAAQAPMIGVNVVLLGFSIYDIVEASVELHKKKKSKGGDLLRKVVAQLDMIKMNNQTKI